MPRLHIADTVAQLNKTNENVIIKTENLWEFASCGYIFERLTNLKLLEFLPLTFHPWMSSFWYIGHWPFKYLIPLLNIDLLFLLFLTGIFFPKYF